MYDGLSLVQYLVIYFLCVGQPEAWEYCKTCNSQQEYCEFGCCGEGETKHCCVNKIAIGVGTGFASLVILLVISAGFLIFMQRRNSKFNNTISTATKYTQYDKDPSSIQGTVYLIGKDLKARRQSRASPPPQSREQRPGGGPGGGGGGGERQPPPPSLMDITQQARPKTRSGSRDITGTQETKVEMPDQSNEPERQES